MLHGLATAATAISLWFPSPSPDSIKLPNLNGDRAEVTVSGISAGGYMALQLLVADSTLYRGAGSIAGGPWHCAKGDSAVAQDACMANTTKIDVQNLINETKAAAAAGHLEDLSNLGRSRVYLYNSDADNVVKKPMLERVTQYVEAFVPATQVLTQHSIPSAHGWPTLDYGNSCGTQANPWLLNCKFDMAGEMLGHLYGALNAKTKAVKSSLKTFDQAEFDTSGDARLIATGWVYIPKACEAKSCKVHVALHGCQQNSDYVQDQFVQHAGLNEWAESNDMIVLYPQESMTMMSNPYACWDWWGYTGSNYATKDGAQLKAITAMVDRLTGH